MFYQAATLLALTASTTLALPTVISRRQDQSSTSVKKGITYGRTGLAASVSQFQGISWAHDWSPDPGNGGIPNGIQYVPELQSKHFGTGDNNEDPECSAFRNRQQVSSAPYLLSINEPDQVGGGGNAMSAQDAANLHSKCLNGLSAKVGTPSVTSDVDNPAHSLGYLDSWLDACNAVGGCDHDFLSVHYQSDSADTTWFKTYYMPKVKAWKDAHPEIKEVWLSEFRCTDKANEAAFLSDIVSWLEDPAQSWINRFSYYLISDDGTTEGGAVASTYSSTT